LVGGLQKNEYHQTFIGLSAPLETYMKRNAVLMSLFALTLGVGPAFASSVTLTFTGLKNLEPIDTYYDGGAGGSGTTGGPNYGISFTSDSLALISEQNGGTGNFSNVPPPASTTIAFFTTGVGDTMDVAAGFTTGFSFYYAAANVPGSVSVYSGLDGTGTLLDTLTLARNGSGCDSSGLGFDCWTETGVAFSGTAKSVVFGGSADQIGFADVTLGASSVPSATPEPSSLVLLGSGVLGLAGAIRRRVLA
jgi:hypothetical protein